ncbi:hypothetical protein BDW74DRAFT_15950 [Aspergillus multicolor]|uniref:NAD-dependent epimerase/dehydratase family protein n=1 Tax=Aspergillus multicolor TaxID=41759 RepID=UPI003CCE1748
MTGSWPSIKSVVISGGTGFVGAAIAREFAERHRNCVITILDLHPPGPDHIVPDTAHFIEVDITDLDGVTTALQQTGPDVVVHTAGIVPVLTERCGRRLEKHVWRVNVDGTRNMLEATKKSGSRTFIYTSTCCVLTDYFGMPLPNANEEWPTPRTSLIYGESKMCALCLYLWHTFLELLTVLRIDF